MVPLAPTPQDIFLIRIFEEPLVPIADDPSPIETTALATALSNYAQRSEPDDFSSLTGFIEAYPTSPWNAALLTNLGIVYYNTGHYSKTLEVWSQAWELAKAVTELKGKAIADRAVGELAYLYGKLGRMAELEALLRSVENRAFSGPATEMITGAREGLVAMQIRPEISFRCGPLALHRIMLAVHPDHPQSALIDAAESTQRGFSLHQVAELSNQLGLNLQTAFRAQGSEFLIPSVVHFKLDHFAAVIRCEGDRYLLQDPTFKNDVWVTGKTLEIEASGYFLVPPGELPAGWRSVDSTKAATVFGKGNVPDPASPPSPCDPSTDPCKPCPDPGDSGGGGGGPRGLAEAKIHLLNASLSISDEPVGYAPPIGPEIRFTVRYNQRDKQFASNFNYSNFGDKWTFDWLAYIKDDPSNPLADVTYYIRGGGNRAFTGFNSATQTYAFQLLDQTKLIRTSPTSYEMLARDGSKKVFSQPDSVGGNTRKVFLTQVIDPFGNAVSLTYDSNLRIAAIADAIGQVTILSYNLPTDIFKITKVTDPFGRFATFEYDASKRLIKIIDVIGLTSEFTYDGDGASSTKSDFITALTTPYGVTKFTKGEDGTRRTLEIQYPDGERERVEFDQNNRIPGSDLPQTVPVGMATRNEFLALRNTYHWDKQGCAYAYGDYTKARIYHWLHSTDLQSPVGILESFKEPLEGRIWYEYADQSSSRGPLVVGSSGKPIHVGRVLDDGSTQLYTYEYNGFGNVTKSIDPVGRTFSYIYADNGIDLLEVRQTRAGQSELLSKKTYNSQHLPLTSKDAAGQTTTYTYNTRGELLTETNPLGDITTYQYDDKGYRASVVDPIGATTRWSYDAFGRVQTTTDVNGYNLTFDYDALDRIKKITYPDSTFDEFTYAKLDRTLAKDRAGRQTSFEYNSVRQMIKGTDPLNRVTYSLWCKCGALKTLTDPMGRTTTWRHDVQGRVKCKEYADGSKVTYLYETSTSRLRQRIDEKLQVTQYNYNRDNSLSSKSYTNATIATPAVSFTYDPNYNRPISMTDGTGATRYRYVPISPVPTLGAGELASEKIPLPNSEITYGYDTLGRQVSTAIDGIALTLTLDAAGRVTSAANALGMFNYTYDGSSFRETSQICSNGLTTERSYAGNLQDLRLHRITHRNGSTPISEFIYGRDVPTGQITSWSQQSDAQVPSIYSFGYDAADQLTSATVSQSGSTVSTFRYRYDAAANRLSEQIDTTTTNFAYNALNELTSSDSTAGAAATYSWDAEQRLVSVNTGNQSTLFTYDGLGRCVGIRRLVSGIEVSNRKFLWRNSEICEERNPGGAVAKRFFVQGMKIEDGSTAGNYFYTRDHLGSIRELTDNAGNVRARYTYEPFGRRTRLFGDPDADFGFAGMFWASESNLSLTLFRAYDSEIGRWFSRDPQNDAELSDSLNLYAYVDNNPVNFTDPFGLQKVGPRKPDSSPPDPPLCRDPLQELQELAACLTCLGLLLLMKSKQAGGPPGAFGWVGKQCGLGARYKSCSPPPTPPPPPPSPSPSPPEGPEPKDAGLPGGV
jgi:RHS repeat-associated protein